MQKNQKIKAAENFRARFLLLAHALQLPRRFGRGQTVMLTCAIAANNKKLAIPGNSLRPIEIHAGLFERTFIGDRFGQNFISECLMFPYLSRTQLLL
jgi:hypothetical protein